MKAGRAANQMVLTHQSTVIDHEALIIHFLHGKYPLLAHCLHLEWPPRCPHTPRQLEQHIRGEPVRINRIIIFQHKPRALHTYRDYKKWQEQGSQLRHFSGLHQILFLYVILCHRVTKRGRRWNVKLAFRAFRFQCLRISDMGPTLWCLVPLLLFANVGYGKNFPFDLLGTLWLPVPRNWNDF